MNPVVQRMQKQRAGSDDTQELNVGTTHMRRIQWSCQLIVMERGEGTGERGWYG